MAAGPGRPRSGNGSASSRWTCFGRTNQEIAHELFISLSTAKAHVAHIQDKLKLRNRTEIAAWAWANRLVTEI
jgi:DNA-binding CsgD family transcriptional regulator